MWNKNIQNFKVNLWENNLSLNFSFKMRRMHLFLIGRVKSSIQANWKRDKVGEIQWFWHFGFKWMKIFQPSKMKLVLQKGFVGTGKVLHKGPVKTIVVVCCQPSSKPAFIGNVSRNVIEKSLTISMQLKQKIYILNYK